MSVERVLVFLLLVAATLGNYTNTLWEHRCDPGSEIFACTVPNFLYKPKQNHSTLIASDTVRKVRLAYPTDKVVVQREIIVAYDATLHAALHRPKAVQIAYVLMQQFEVPVDLEYADFRYNSIEKVIAPEVNGSEYALRYLDLRSNDLDRIDSLKHLVNLETLLLLGNRINSLDGSVLKSFTKLTTLNLAGNSISEVAAGDLPASLQVLILRHNGMFGAIDFNGAHLPALKVLDLYNNLFSELDMDLLLSAAPKLEGIRLDSNYFSTEDAKAIAERLTLAGVAHDQFLKHDHEDSDEVDNYYRTQEKLKMQEHIISAMLAVINVCVIGWGFYQVYKSRNSAATGRENCSSA